MLTILKDAENSPQLFHWNGPINKNKLYHWIDDNNLEVPQGLLDFWLHTGGGDFFESETILGPFVDNVLGDNFLEYNNFHRNRGLPKDYWVFHTGLGITAIKKNVQEIWVLDDSNFRQVDKFIDFEDWYINYIRANYGERYKLNELASLIK